MRLAELNGELAQLLTRMNGLQKQMDELNPDSSQVKVYRDVHRVLEEMLKPLHLLKRKTFAVFLLRCKISEWISGTVKRK